MSYQAKLGIYFAGKELETLAVIESFTQKERLHKAFKAFAICCLVGAICVFVPVLHFVLTPLALVVAPFAAFFVYEKVKGLPKTVQGQIPCANCGTVTSFHFKEDKPPLYDACQSCKTGFEVLWPPKEIVT